jgi:hypothetical protein
MIHMKTADTWTFQVGPITYCDKSPVDLSEAKVSLIFKRQVSDNDADALVRKDIERPESNILNYTLSMFDTRFIQEGHYVIGVKIFWEDETAQEIWRDILVVEKGVFSA